jgi:hypothetical protein
MLLILAALALSSPDAEAQDTVLALGGPVLDLLPCDFDGDGDTDLLACTGGQGRLTLVRREASSWSSHVLRGGLVHPSAVAISSGGTLLICDEGQRLAILTAPGGDSLRQLRRFVLPAGPGDAHPTEDGHFLVTLRETGEVVGIPGAGCDSAPPRPLLGLAGAKSVVAEDLDGDGHSDLAASGCGSGLLLAFGGKTGFAAQHRERFFDGIKALETADVDGDGLTDVIGIACGRGGVAWWRNPGERAGWRRAFLHRGCRGPKCVLAVDGARGGTLLLVGSVGGDGLLAGPLVGSAWFRFPLWQARVTAVAAFFRGPAAVTVTAGALDGRLRIMELPGG